MPPVHEANGQQLSSNIPIGSGWTPAAPSPTRASPRARASSRYLPNGRPYYPQHNNWQPRLGIAYRPKAERTLKFLFGHGKTSIRAGAGMYYDLVGQPLAGFIANNSYGLSTSLASRRMCTRPRNCRASSALTDSVGAQRAALLPAGAQPTFPVSYPNAFAITSSLDDRLKAPYTMNLNFSIAREFSHGWFVQGSYVGRLSRHNLVQRDLAMPTNLKRSQVGPDLLPGDDPAGDADRPAGRQDRGPAEDSVLRELLGEGGR